MIPIIRTLGRNESPVKVTIRDTPDAYADELGPYQVELDPGQCHLSVWATREQVNQRGGAFYTATMVPAMRAIAGLVDGDEDQHFRRDAA